MSSIPYVRLKAGALVAAASALFAAPAFAGDLPANLGGGLRPLLERYQAAPSAFPAYLSESKRLNTDQKGRVLVEIHPSGALALDSLQSKIAGLGANVTSVHTNYRNGVIAAYVPMEGLSQIARTESVKSVILVHKPVTNVGATTSQGAAVIKSDLVNAAGITGTGITVGVMSDSYNKNRRAKTTASADVTSGDLPNLTNTVAGSPGVKFLIDGPAGTTDEGRGMAQIVYDVAPGADLCFATAYNTQSNFADHIRELRTNAACNADIIVDDVIYFAEPMFSDGVIAQAVDEVVTSTSLAGKRVAYFSSAGNNGKGYSDKFRYVSDADARGSIDAADGSVNLTTIPATIDTSGGFQDFNSSTSSVDISQVITCAGAACSLVLQWDDPFDAGGITSDFNLLIFDTSGNFVSAASLTDDNFSTDEPLEISATDLTADTSYRVVIARTGAGAHSALYLRYVSFGGTLIAQYADKSGTYASTYGHAAAANANGVAAYVYDDVPSTTPPFDTYSAAIEGFTSPGPVKILFDAAGNRLASPVTRKKPDMAAPDGGNTTFFPPGQLSATDYEGDGFPNFFGTSAAAPHAAGAAALLLAKAGGPGKLSAGKIRNKLQQTAPARDIDPLHAAATTGDGSLTVTINGDTPTDPKAFKIALSSSSTHTLNALDIDVSPSGLQFDPSVDTGFPVTVGQSNGPTITSVLPTTAVPALNFTFSGFVPGKSLSFGVDRDIAELSAYGNSADLLESSTITATFTDGSQSGVFANLYGTGYYNWDGYGLIDAQAAAATIP